jgi:hypothetical protein
VHNSYKCIFAHSSSVRNIAGGKKKAAFAPNRPASQVFCVAFDKNAAEGSMNARASRLYTSADWFSKVSNGARLFSSVLFSLEAQWVG